MSKYDPLAEKIAEKIGKPKNYIVQRISQKARAKGILPEVEMVNWAKSLKIPYGAYANKLDGDIKSQIYPRPSSVNGDVLSKSSVFKIVRIGKKDNQWYNLWWVQLLIAFFVVGIVAGTISQVLGMYFGKLFSLSN